MIDPDSVELNSVSINGFPSPGRARITGAGQPSTWEVRKGLGLSGATIIFRGRDLASPTLMIDLWTKEHFAAWEVWKKLLDPPKSTSPKLALGISHPLLADVGIVSVVVEDRTPPEKQSNGIWTVTIKLKEYRAPIPANLKPRGSVPAAGGAPKPAVTEADKALVEAQKAAAAAKAAAG